MSVDKQVFTILEFCQRNGMGKSFYYELSEEDRPNLLNFAGKAKQLVTIEEEAAWRKRQVRKAMRRAAKS